MTSRHDTEPVAFGDLDPASVLDAVESLGLVCDGRLLELNSFENRVYQVGIENDTPRIAKFYRQQRWTDEAILEEHDFTLECAEQELPVVPPISVRNRTLHEHGGYRFSLFMRRGGHAPPLDDPEALRIIGRFLARLHNVGAAGRFLHRPAILDLTACRDSRDAVLADSLLPDHMEEAYRTLTDHLLERLEPAFAQQYTATIRLHGDFHPGNILWRDEAPHVVDFDDARTGPVIQDLWMFLPGERAERETMLDALLDGYTTFRDFDPGELALIEPLRAARLLHYGGWLTRRHREPAFRRAFPWASEARWWEDHVLILREQLGALDESALDWRPAR